MVGAFGWLAWCFVGVWCIVVCVAGLEWSICIGFVKDRLFSERERGGLGDGMEEMGRCEMLTGFTCDGLRERSGMVLLGVLGWWLRKG